MSPANTLTSRPSIVKAIVSLTGLGTQGLLDELALAAGPRGLDVVLELLAELLHHRADRHRHRIAEDAEAVADDLLLDGGHDVEVHRRREAGVDALEHRDRPARPLAARRALAAGLV